MNKSVKSNCIKRIFSLLTRGSMTVEAAIVLPLFMFFFLTLLSSIEMIRLHSNLSMALWNVGNDLSFYGSFLTDGSSEKKDMTRLSYDSGIKELLYEIGDMAVSYTYIRNRVIDYCGSKYLANSVLTYGESGLNFIESDIFGEDDNVDITLTYDVSPQAFLGKIIHFRMSNKYFGHLWNGYDVTSDKKTSDKTVFVYVAKDSDVYHKSSACTYLRLSVHAVSFSEIDKYRNIDGEKYYPCLICGFGSGENVYICNEGNKYHYDRDCYTLIKKYKIVTLSSVVGTHHPCVRCGG